MADSKMKRNPVVSTSSPLDDFNTHRLEVEAAISRVLESGVYIDGKETEAFEVELAEYIGAKHVISVNSGTDALSLSLRALGIGIGDEVITVSHTALATVAAIVATGATPVVIDVDPSTMTMDVHQVLNAVGEHTKAIMPVHLYGHPADMVDLEKIASVHGIPIVEDCAQAIGAEISGRRVGTIGHLGCFSFYPTKNLGAMGDGGAITTNDDHVASRLRRIKQYGWDAERIGQEFGVNSRMDEIQAAILRTKLNRLDQMNRARQQIAETYLTTLADSAVSLPVTLPAHTHVYHLFVVQHEQRDSIRTALRSRGIGAGIHYATPAHLHPGYRQNVRVAHSDPKTFGLPITEKLARTVLSIPVHPGLSTSASMIANDVKEIIDSIN